MAMVSGQKFPFGDSEIFQLLIDSIEDYAIYMLDPTGHVVTWNRGAEFNKGYSKQEAIGRHLRTFFTPEDVVTGQPEKELETASRRGRSTGEGWRMRKNGERYWVSYAITAIRDSRGVLLGYAKVARDITDRKQQEDALRAMDVALREERNRLHGAAESSMDALFICEALRNPEGDIEDFVFTYLNSNVEKMVFLSRDAMLGGRMCRVLPVHLSLGLFERYKAVVDTGEPLVHEFAINDNSIKSSWIRVQAVKLADGIAITASDITDRKQGEERILHLAHHDSLTGLPNRSLLLDRIEQGMERANRYNQFAAVFLVDVDDFKKINDTYGHSVGDQALMAIAQRLTAAVRKTDSVIRVGGDEFIVVMPEVSAIKDIQACGATILDRLRLPLALVDFALDATASVGGAIYPRNASSASQLLTAADAAMYVAKRRGKNQFELATD